MLEIRAANEQISPIHWLASRKGSLNALKRIVADSTNSLLYITNDLEQPPYLFAVKCGDRHLMEYTSDSGNLEHFRDGLGRNAVYFSIFSTESARKLFSGTLPLFPFSTISWSLSFFFFFFFFSGSTWYTTQDDLGSPPLHHTILNGAEDVVSYVLFEVLPTLSSKEQRAVFESYDARFRTPMMLLVEKYPVFAKKLMDIYGIQKGSYEGGSDENVKVRTTYNTWLITSYQESKLSQFNKAAHMMVSLNRMELVSHPLVVYLFEKKKWKGIIRILFWVEFVLQLFIVAILAFAMIFSSYQTSLGAFYTDVFTGKGWLGLRLAIIILAMIDLIWRMFVPIRTLLVVRSVDITYRTLSYLAYFVALIM